MNEERRAADAGASEILAVRPMTIEELKDFVADFCKACRHYNPNDPLCEPAAGLKGAREAAWERGFCRHAEVIDPVTGIAQPGLMTNTGFLADT